MPKFDDLVNGLEKHKESVNDYFLNFFSKANYRKYEIEGDPDKDERKAIRIMFESRKQLRERIEDALSYDPYCKEAFFVYYIISENVYVNYRFEDYYGVSDQFGDFSDFQKQNYLKIMNYYVEFLLEIHNITCAIKVQRMIIRLSNDLSKTNINRLSYMYAKIEKVDDFYRLYLDCEFDAYDYLLLIVTLLKHDDKMKAKEVLFEMYDRIPYADYLDHMWDLDENDPKQDDFYTCVEDCYNEISSVPGFFAWVNITSEERL